MMQLRLSRALFPYTTLFRSLDEEALRALAALDRILPAQVRAEVGAVSGAMGVITRAAPSARSEVLMSLASAVRDGRSEEHTSELQSRGHLVCSLLLEI